METISKSIFKSTTFWGLVLVVIGPTLNRFGIVVGDTASAAADISTIVGSIIALYGRASATQPLHVVAPTEPDPMVP